MLLIYYFGRYDDEEFEYNTDVDEYVNYLKDNPKEVEELIKDLYDEDEELRKFASEYGIKNKEEIDASTDDGNYFIYDALSEFVDEETLEKYKEDEIKEFYKEDASIAYEDSKLDPYTYSGVSPMDFF